jgi:transcriptional regulator with XRE-family HTH domain
MRDVSLIGMNVKKFRMLHDLTQNDLAVKCHVAVGTIRNIECGVRYPSLDLLMDIAEALYTTVDSLIQDGEKNEIALCVSGIVGRIARCDNSSELAQTLLETTEIICKRFGVEKRGDAE